MDNLHNGLNLELDECFRSPQLQEEHLKIGKISKIGGARNVLRYGKYTHAKLANFVCTKLKDEQETFSDFKTRADRTQEF